MFALNGDHETQVLYGELVSDSYFSMLGLRPAKGSFVSFSDPAATAPSAVISHELWNSRFDADPNIVGSTIALNGHQVPIAAVAPKAFKGMVFGLSADVWLPLSSSQQVVSRKSRLDDRGSRWLFVKGRLMPGVRWETARERAAILSQNLASTFADSNEGYTFTVFPPGAVRFHPSVDRNLTPVAALLLVISGLVLLIACTNVAGLLLARAVARLKEMAVRLALGATRRHLIRQLLTESVVLSTCGGALGLLFAYWAVHALTAFHPPLPVPISIDLPIDARVVLFTLTLSIVAGIAFGIAPALKVSGANLLDGIKISSLGTSAGSKRFRLRNVLLASQVAVSLVLLVAAGLFIQSIQQLQKVDIGFDRTHAIVLSPGLWFTNTSEEEGKRIYQQLIERIGSLPGVRSVVLANRIPLGVQIMAAEVRLPESSSSERGIEADYAIVDRGYFRALRVPLLRGEDFPESNSAAPRVAIVSEAMASRFWPGKDAIGQTFGLGGGAFVQVIGIARQTKVRTLGEAPRPYVYLPYRQNYDSSMSLVIETVESPAAVLKTLRREVEAIQPDLPIVELKTMEEHLQLMLYPPKIGAMLLGAFGLLGLILASLGLYGAVSYSVSRRTSEVGVRLALGARTPALLTMFLRESMTTVISGLLAGLAIACIALQPLSAFIYGIRPRDPLTLAVLFLVLACVAVVATLIPARRALAISPSIAFRS
jgi:predicted permease